MRETPLRSLKRIRDGRETPFAAGDTTGHYAPRVVENEDGSKRSRLQGDDALEKFLMFFDLVAEDEQDWECLDGSAADLPSWSPRAASSTTDAPTWAGLRAQE